MCTSLAVIKTYYNHIDRLWIPGADGSPVPARGLKDCKSYKETQTAKNPAERNQKNQIPAETSENKVERNKCYNNMFLAYSHNEKYCGLSVKCKHAYSIIIKH